MHSAIMFWPVLGAAKSQKKNWKELNLKSSWLEIKPRYYFDLSTKSQEKVWIFNEETSMSVRNSRSAKKKMVVFSSLLGALWSAFHSETVTGKWNIEEWMPTQNYWGGEKTHIKHPHLRIIIWFLFKQYWPLIVSSPSLPPSCFFNCCEMGSVPTPERKVAHFVWWLAPETSEENTSKV